MTAPLRTMSCADRRDRLAPLALLAGALLPLRMALGGVNVTPADLALVTLVCCTIAAVRPACAWRAETVLYFACWLGAVALFLGGMLAGTLDDSGMSERALLFLQYTFVLVVVPIGLLGRSDAVLRWMLVGYAWGVVLLTVASVVLVLLDPLLAMATGALSGSGRLAAFVGNSNAYSRQAGIASLVLFWGTGERAWPRSRRRSRWVCAAGLFVTLAGAVLAQSFGGLLALTGALLLVAALSGRLATVTIGGALFGAVAATALLAASLRDDLPTSSRLVRAMQSGEIAGAGTFDERSQLKGAAWRRIEQAPLRGLGADRFRETTESGQGAHDTLLLIWAEGGMAALAGFVLLLALLGVVHVRAHSAGDLDHMVAMSVGIYALFLMALVVNNHVYARGLTVPVLLAGAISLLRGERRASPTATTLEAVA